MVEETRKERMKRLMAGMADISAWDDLIDEIYGPKVLAAREAVRMVEVIQARTKYTLAE